MSNLRSTQNDGEPLEEMSAPASTYASQSAMSPNMIPHHSLGSFWHKSPYSAYNSNPMVATATSSGSTLPADLTFGKPSTNTPTDEDLVRDEKYARQVQAELDAEENEEHNTSSWDGDADDSEHDSFYNFKPIVGPNADIDSEHAQVTLKEFDGANDASTVKAAHSLTDFDGDEIMSEDFATPLGKSNQQSVDATEEDAIPDEKEEERKTLQAFGQSMLAMTCSYCKKQLLPSKDAVLAYGRTLIKDDCEVAGTVNCRTCNTKTCIGCGWANSHKSTTKRSNQIDLCCSTGRLFLIWVWLCVLDDEISYSSKRKIKVEQPKPAAVLDNRSAMSRSAMPLSADNGTGYVTIYGLSALPH